MFRRRSNKGSARSEEATAKDSAETSAGAAGTADDAESAAAERADGPWDVAEVPDDDLVRIDLGGLRVPAPEGIELRVEADPTGTVAAVLLIDGASTLALGAFAAPRRQGIWAEVRTELLASLRADGGDGKDCEGPFGTELAATVVAPEGRQLARFVGIDGPCWFLRGVFTGPAATDPNQATALEQALRQVVVFRGGDALPVRDPLPLVLPPEVIEKAAEEAARPPAAPERGPEITEIG